LPAGQSTTLSVQRTLSNLRTFDRKAGVKLKNLFHNPQRQPCPFAPKGRVYLPLL